MAVLKTKSCQKSAPSSAERFTKKTFKRPLLPWDQCRSCIKWSKTRFLSTTQSYVLTNKGMCEHNFNKARPLEWQQKPAKKRRMKKQNRVWPIKKILLKLVFKWRILLDNIVQRVTIMISDLLIRGVARYRRWNWFCLPNRANVYTFECKSCTFESFHVRKEKGNFVFAALRQVGCLL